MLSRLGKWLRAAGYDTLIITSSIPDREVLDLALSDHRILVTRDRHFLKMTAAKPLLIYLRNNDFDGCIKEINHTLQINWLYAPFSRCLICNTLFEKPNFNDQIEHIPLSIRQQKPEFWYCPRCQKFYWEGTHTENMRLQLSQWQKNNQAFL
jgi:uncharacterized protein